MFPHCALESAHRQIHVHARNTGVWSDQWCALPRTVSDKYLRTLDLDFYSTCPNEPMGSSKVRERRIHAMDDAAKAEKQGRRKDPHHAVREKELRKALTAAAERERVPVQKHAAPSDSGPARPRGQRDGAPPAGESNNGRGPRAQVPAVLVVRRPQKVRGPRPRKAIRSPFDRLS